MMDVEIAGVGVLAPGLPSWQEAKARLAEGEWSFEPLRSPAPGLLPGAERRRASLAIRLAVEIAQQATSEGGIEPASLATVFASCDGDGDTIHAVLEAIPRPDHPVSPTRFSNSVHNAPAGYWSIAAAAAEPSTSLCAWEGSAAAGLLESATQVASEGASVLFVCSDCPLPAPLAQLHPYDAPFGAALVLVPPRSGSPRSTKLIVAIRPALDRERDALPAPFGNNAAARLLPLLVALARGGARSVRLPYLPDLDVVVELRE